MKIKNKTRAKRILRKKNAPQRKMSEKELFLYNAQKNAASLFAKYL